MGCGSSQSAVLGSNDIPTAELPFSDTQQINNNETKDVTNKKAPSNSPSATNNVNNKSKSVITAAEIVQQQPLIAVSGSVPSGKASLYISNKEDKTTLNKPNIQIVSPIPADGLHNDSDNGSRPPLSPTTATTQVESNTINTHHPPQLTVTTSASTQIPNNPSPSVILTPKERYQFTGETLGRGHFAKVKKVKDVLTGIYYACKIIERKDMVKSSSIVRAEVEILLAVKQHTNIVSLIDHYEDESRFYLIMELCEGGDLFSRIVEQGKYTEKQAAECCRQLASALHYIHNIGVIHRDLKPENILLTHKGHDAQLKVADFGLSKLMKDDEHVMKTICGTWAYCAPEVIMRKPYSPKVDNWTLGVMMFILLAGYHPFDVYGELPEPELLKKIVACSYDFNDSVWKEVSEEAKQLIRSLLQFDPNKRMTLQDYLNSSWIKSITKHDSADKDLSLVAERLQKYNIAGRQLRALVYAKLASNKFKASLSRSTTPKANRKMDFNLSAANGGQTITGSPVSRNSIHNVGFGNISLGPTHHRDNSLSAQNNQQLSKERTLTDTQLIQENSKRNKGTAVGILDYANNANIVLTPSGFHREIIHEEDGPIIMNNENCLLELSRGGHSDLLIQQQDISRSVTDQTPKNNNNIQTNNTLNTTQPIPVSSSNNISST